MFRWHQWASSLYYSFSCVKLTKEGIENWMTRLWLLMQQNNIKMKLIGAIETSGWTLVLAKGREFLFLKRQSPRYAQSSVGAQTRISWETQTLVYRSDWVYNIYACVAIYTWQFALVKLLFLKSRNGKFYLLSLKINPCLGCVRPTIYIYRSEYLGTKLYQRLVLKVPMGC
jgi:hypothetical protein